ncbi:hypothetical protein AHAS_Ahas18G0227900, partial [Arachis hypogaea]
LLLVEPDDVKIVGASGIMIEVSEGGGGVKMERGRVKGEKSQENIALIALLHGEDHLMFLMLLQFLVFYFQRS